MPVKLNLLFVLQKKVVRLIAGVPPRSRSDKLFYDLNLLSVKDILLLQEAIFVYECINETKPSHFAEMFSFNRNYHNYHTRSSSCLHQESHKTKAYRKNIRFTGPKIRNKLPEDVRNVPRVNTFKYKLKKKKTINFKPS